jgi:hypothetical protein
VAGVGEVFIGNYCFVQSAEKNDGIDVGCYRPPEASNIRKDGITGFTENVDGVRGAQTDCRYTTDPDTRANAGERPPEEKCEPVVVPEDPIELISNKPAVPGTEVMTLPKEFPGNVVRRLAGSENLIEEFRGVTEQRRATHGAICRISG